MTTNNKQKLPETSPRIKKVFRELISLMIGDEDKTFDQVEEITSDNMPIEMREREGAVLDGIYYARQHGMNPTRENIITYLELRRFKEPDAFLDSILADKPDDDIGIRSISAFASTWVEEQKGINVSEKVAALMKDPSMTYHDRYELASSMWFDASPTNDDIRTYTESESFDLFLKDQADLYKARQSGLDIGPTMPFEAHKAFFSRLKFGQMSSIFAKTGAGKTTLLMNQAEHVAWRQKLNCDVVVIFIETDQLTIQRRQFARHSLIPFDTLDNGGINLDDERWKPKVQQFRDVFEKRSETQGHIHYVYAYDVTAERLIQLINRYSKTSHSVGRNIFIGIDYIQKINWSVYYRQTQAQSYELISTRLAGAASKNNAHLMVLAQENEAGEAHGSSFVRKVSQLTFSIKRTEELITEDLPILIGEKKTRLVDAFGKQRYWVRKGDKMSHKGVLEMVKANDSPMGSINVFFEGPFNSVVQDPKQVELLKQQKRLP